MFKLTTMKSLQLLPFFFTSFLPLCLLSQTAGKSASLTGDWLEKTDSAQEIKLISPTHVFFFV
ncbi:MAG TPA: hypothetical protein VFL47_13105, partial [Flavisolibacter sp.]|nr:hypothetical protein [Flavisolibacter sp.]